MTAYGFDLDGTLDLPGIAQLANDLYDAGHQVYVITGGLADSGEWTFPARKARLAELGIHYTEIIRCIDADINQMGRLKGEACARLGIAVLLDDSPGYLSGARGISAAARLLVMS